MKAVISYPFDKRLLDVFASEDSILSRASYEIKVVGDEINFVFQAEDATAMRVAINAVLKLLMVWEGVDV